MLHYFRRFVDRALLELCFIFALRASSFKVDAGLCRSATSQSGPYLAVRWRSPVVSGKASTRRTRCSPIIARKIDACAVTYRHKYHGFAMAAIIVESCALIRIYIRIFEATCSILRSEHLPCIQTRDAPFSCPQTIIPFYQR